MKLKEVEISEFQSIRHSNSFKVGDITYLVGKNEAGWTALLQALYRLNPIIAPDGNYNINEDYPRKDVEDYRHDVERGSREPATVAKATYTLEETELEKLQNDFSKDVLQKPELVLTKGYDNALKVTLEVNRNSALNSLFKNAQLSSEDTETLLQLSDISEQLDFLKKTDLNQEDNQLITVFNSIDKLGGLDEYIYKNYLEPQVPKFLLFDEFYQLRGHDNIEALIQRKKDGKLTPSDYPLLGLIELARLKLEELTTSTRTRELKNNLEGAANHLTKKIVDYWSQNKHF